MRTECSGSSLKICGFEALGLVVYYVGVQAFGFRDEPFQNSRGDLCKIAPSRTRPVWGTLSFLLRMFRACLQTISPT